MMYSLLKKTKICQVCNKAFPNGRALGGHMRSHTRKLSASNVESATSSAIPPLKTFNKLDASFRPRETVLMRSVHVSEAGVGPKPDLKTQEGGQQISGKRKIVVDVDEVDATESQLCLKAHEEGASCLISISKGEKPDNSQNPTAIDQFLLSLARDEKDKQTENYIEIDSDDEGKVKYKYVVHLLNSSMETLIEDNDDDDEEEEDNETYLVAREESCKKKFMCDICGKVLQSYQALGGHRTSHRTKRVKICEKNDQVVQRHYECEICGRVFESGQALGGHKKVHYVFLQPSN